MNRLFMANIALNKIQALINAIDRAASDAAKAKFELRLEEAICQYIDNASSAEMKKLEEVI